ncbi:putative 3,4-dihydroxy-2-butanone kinase [Miscanthus floridulus]|uniref:putative 3,4-dihydroxy-2-butanone kinase n=1 Tax=Miscanthus floridulus TaxID=154761 RepID=UPI0034589574
MLTCIKDWELGERREQHAVDNQELEDSFKNLYLDEDEAAADAPGILNYTGDRLNFGLAVEQAKSEGYKMEMVIVGDDCALPPPRGIAGRRGLAGTILVHKVAGAAADAGLSLVAVAAEAKHASEVVGTMGVALSFYGLLLGATPIMELMIAARKAVPELQLVYGIAVDRVYTGTLMTSLDMADHFLSNQAGRQYCFRLFPFAGLSITIMKSDDSILKRLDAPTKAPAWPVGSEGNRPPAKFPVPLPPSPSIKDDEIFAPSQELSKQGCILEAAIEASATAIINLKDSLNEWDSKVGDGDCGTTVS